MTRLRRADQRVPDHGVLPEPLTWDYAQRGPKGSRFAEDLALVTCRNRHTLRLSARVHRIAASGAVSPSWVCTAAGCEFHEFIELEGYDVAGIAR